MATKFLYKPFPDSLITQGFSENANISYARSGLIGHTTLDYGVACGTPVPNCAENAFVYSIMNKDNPDLSKYRAVFTLVELEDVVYEISYGHLDQILVVAGQTLQPGESVGLSGNTGMVFMHGVEVTNEIRKKIKCAGGHLHGPQVRVCRKVTKKQKGKHYLSDSLGTYKSGGFYYEVVDYDNGTNGCINPNLLFNGKFAKDYAAHIASQVKQISLLKQVIALLKRKLGIA